jgi:hypothetical protein
MNPAWIATEDDQRDAMRASACKNSICENLRRGGQLAKSRVPDPGRRGLKVKRKREHAQVLAFSGAGESRGAAHCFVKLMAIIL